MAHQVEIKFVGECWQQRLYEVSDPDDYETLQDFIADEEYDEVKERVVYDEDYGEYVETSYLTRDVRIVVMVDGEEVIDENIDDFIDRGQTTALPAAKELVDLWEQSDYYDEDESRVMLGADSFLLDNDRYKRADDNNGYECSINCVADFTYKNSCLSFSFEIEEEFDLSKIKLIENQKSNAFFDDVCSDGLYFADQIVYGDKAQYVADEDSTNYGTSFGIGQLLACTGELALTYVLQEDELLQYD